MDRCFRSFSVTTLLLTSLVLLNMGATCSFSGLPGLIAGPPPVVVVVPDFVDVELINEADGPVDPGLYVDGGLFDDVPLNPGEATLVTFDCFDSTSLLTDALLLINPAQAIASDNSPQIFEGLDFLCGDTVSFIFVENGVDPFFTRVEVNGVFLTD